MKTLLELQRKCCIYELLYTIQYNAFSALVLVEILSTVIKNINIARAMKGIKTSYILLTNT